MVLKKGFVSGWCGALTLRRFLLVTCSLGMVVSGHAFLGETQPVSKALPEFGPTGASVNPSISPDGRYVAFQSSAADHLPGDTNGVSDAFVRDRVLGTTVRVSVSATGLQGNGPSYRTSISFDGRYVAFVSEASNLVLADTNGFGDIFVHDTMWGHTNRVSVDSSGIQANNTSDEVSISSDGRFVAFASVATNLVSGDTNGRNDIFLRDLVAGTTVRVSLDSSGTQGNNNSYAPSISGDGRYVAFESVATNLVAGDTNGHPDIFVRDLVTGTTTRASVRSSGTQGNNVSSAPSISSDGRYVAFASDASNLVTADTNNRTDIFVRDRLSGSTSRASVGSGGFAGFDDSYSPVISGNGRYVAFTSASSSLVVFDTNGVPDIFLRDLDQETTTRINVDSSEDQSNGESGEPVLSADGELIAFSSTATNLESGDTNASPDAFLRNRPSGTTSRLSKGPGAVLGNGDSVNPVISAKGGRVAFQTGANNLVANDTNSFVDIYVKDVGVATNAALVSKGAVLANGDSQNPSISADGRFIAFDSFASNLVSGDTNGQRDIFISDRAAPIIYKVSFDQQYRGLNGESLAPSVSSDGLYVAYESLATNVVAIDTNGFKDVFWVNRVSNVSELVSVSSAGVQANGPSSDAQISSNARYVAFSSEASNLVAGDSNSKSDIFVRDVSLNSTTLASVSTDSLLGDDSSTEPALSGDARYVAFESLADNLVAGDTNARRDVFVRDLIARTTIRVSVDSSGTQANNHSRSPSISAEGRFVAFISDATNLVPGDTNGKPDVFVRDLVEGTTIRVSVNSVGSQSNGPSEKPAIAGEGKFVAFQSSSTDLTGFEKLSAATIDCYRHELSPATGPVTAILALESWVGPTPPSTADFVLRTSGGTAISSGSIGVALDGRIKVPKPGLGDFELLVKVQGFLQKKTAFTQGTATVDLGTIPLLNGDVDGDNSVTIFDYIELSQAFDTSLGDPDWNSSADLDGDETVTIFDYIILSQNFDRTGDE